MVSFADLLWAVGTLEAKGETVAKIATLLDIVREPAASYRPEARTTIPGPDRSARPGRDDIAVHDPAVTSISDVDLADTRDVVASTLEPIPTERYAGPGSVPLRPQPMGLVPGRPPFDPLLAPGWARAVLTSALATAGDDGAIDIEEIVPKIATKSPIERLPRLARPTMRRGVQLLIDRGPALAPFARDQEWLIEQVRRVAGKDRLQVLDFYACPTRPGPLGEDGEPVPYATPAAGTTVMLMTDLGIGRPPGWTDWADDAEWLDFAGRLRKAGCPLVALVPYPEPRWSALLAARIPILAFDRPTAASTVRRLLRGGHPVMT